MRGRDRRGSSPRAAATRGGRHRHGDALAAQPVRCADFEGQRYCLGTGWTDHAEAEVAGPRAAAATPARDRRAATETPATSTPTALAQRAALSPAARAAPSAPSSPRPPASVAKVWLLRHQIQGVAAARRLPRPGTRRPRADRTTPRDAATHAPRAQDARDYPAGPDPQRQAGRRSRRRTGAARRRCR